MNRNTIEKFWLRVDKSGVQTEYVTTPCWDWIGRLGSNGYAQFDWDGRRTTVHRFSYELVHRAVPNGLEIHHLCHNTRCVNPEHLEAVTHRENMSEWAATKTHCKYGHLLDEENTGFCSNGYRYCKICSNKRAGEWYARQKGVVTV